MTGVFNQCAGGLLVVLFGFFWRAVQGKKRHSAQISGHQEASKRIFLQASALFLVYPAERIYRSMLEEQRATMKILRAGAPATSLLGRTTHHTG